MLNITPYPMRFEGSGKEYFRVWSVNVLLCIVTLSLYTPWARWRTAHYFYGHTFIAGSPLEFTGQKRRMVKGFLAFAALYFAYELASYTEQDTAVNLFMLCGALLTPFMWRSAIRFRVNNTRWRGLRLQFTATLGEVYRYSWPLYVVVAFWAFVYWALMNPSDSLFALPHWTELLFKNKWRALGWLALFLLLSALGLSHVDYNYRRLTVERTTFAGQPSRWKPRYRDFAKIWLYSLVIGAISLAVFIRFNVFVYQWMKEWESAAGTGTGTDSWWMQALWMLCMMLCRRSSTSPAVQFRRMAFWLISRPLVATPPALDALPGAKQMPASMNRSTASRVDGMFAPSETTKQPFLSSASASLASISFCVALGNAASHLTPHGRCPARNWQS